MRRTRGAAFIALLGIAGGAVWFANEQHWIDGPAWLGGSRQAAQNAGGASARKVAPTSVVTEAAAQSDFPVKQRSIGYITPMATVAVKSRVQSQLLTQNFTEGQVVKKGDLLFTLDDREFAAQVAKDQAAIARDQATLTRAGNDLSRAQQLISRGAGTQQALDQATADQQSAAAALQGDQASLDTDKLKLSYTRIYAPIAGRTGAVTVTPGNLVNASDSGPGLVTVTQMQPVYLTFALPERDLGAVQAAERSTTPPQVRVFPHGTKEATGTGKLVFVDSAVDQSSGTITLRAEFANADMKLWPGEYCDVEIDLGVHPKAVSVPTVALQIGQNGNYVFVVGPDSTAKVRDVKIGLADGNSTEVAAGLDPGEKVVIDGQLRLANGAPVHETATASNGPAAEKTGVKG